jgi:hypothetical protein
VQGEDLDDFANGQQDNLGDAAGLHCANGYASNKIEQDGNERKGGGFVRVRIVKGPIPQDGGQVIKQDRLWLCSNNEQQDIACDAQKHNQGDCGQGDGEGWRFVCNDELETRKGDNGQEKKVENDANDISDAKRNILGAEVLFGSVSNLSV